MSHFATEDLAILRALPDMAVVAPSDPWQAFDLTKQLYARGGPSYLRLDKGKAGLPADGPPTVLGKVRTVREGDAAVIFATGAILSEALAAAATLAEEGVEVRVVDVHTIKPFDAEGVCAAARTSGIVVTVEEHSIVGGLGGAVAEACLEGGVGVRGFRRIGLADRFPSVVGDQDYLRAHYGMDRHAVIATLRALLNGSG